MKNVAVFFADGFEEVEAITPVDYLRRAGANVIMVAVPSPTMSDKLMVTGSHKIPMIMDCTLEDYLKDFTEGADCVFCPGGLTGSKNLSETEVLLKHLETCFDNGKIVSAICASPAVILGKTKVLNGKKWTCYPGMAEEAKAEYVKLHEDKAFVTDGNVVTGRAAGAAEEFAMELVRIVCGQELADKVQKGTVQR